MPLESAEVIYLFILHLTWTLKYNAFEWMFHLPVRLKCEIAVENQEWMWSIEQFRCQHDCCCTFWSDGMSVLCLLRTVWVSFRLVFPPILSPVTSWPSCLEEIKMQCGLNKVTQVSGQWWHLLDVMSAFISAPVFLVLILQSEMWFSPLPHWFSNSPGQMSLLIQTFPRFLKWPLKWTDNLRHSHVSHGDIFSFG